MTDLEALQGVWHVTELESAGRTVSPAAFSGARLVLAGNRFESLGMGAVYEGTLRLDPSASPRAIDLQFTNGPEKGRCNAGIYELLPDGWRLCLNTLGPGRPGLFQTAPGTGLALEVLKRTAPEPAPVRFSSHDLEPAAELQGEWRMISGHVDGQPIPENMVRTARRSVEGTRMSVTFGSYVHSRAEYTVDRSRTPAAITVYNAEGPHAGKTQTGIYQRTDDTLTISLAAPESAKPADFAVRPGDGRTVVLWRLIGR